MSLFWGGDIEFGVGSFDENDHVGTPWVGYVIMVLCLLASCYVFFTGIPEKYFMFPVNFSFFLRAGENFDFLQLSVKAITSLLVQSNIYALMLSIFFFCVFADNVEYAMGHLRFIVFFIVAAYLSLWVTYAVVHPLQVPLSGFTGVIGVIIGAYVRIFPKVKFNLYRDNNILDNGPLISLIIPFTRVRWAQVGVVTYSLLWYISSFFFVFLGTGFQGASTHLCYHFVALVIGYSLTPLFRDKSVAILDQEVMTYEKSQKYISGETNEYSPMKENFAFYDGKAVDPTIQIDSQNK